MESVDKRLLLLQAASKRFSTYGFHETKVEGIAEEAGVAKGTVYLYFKDKNQLLLEVARYHMSMYMENVKEELAGYDTARDKLYAYARFYRSRFPEMVKFHKLNFEQLMKARHDDSMLKEMRDSQREILGVVEQIIEYGIEVGEFRPVNATDAALIVQGALHTYLHSVMLEIAESREMSKAESMVDLILNGLGK